VYYRVGFSFCDTLRTIESITYERYDEASGKYVDVAADTTLHSNDSAIGVQDIRCVSISFNSDTTKYRVCATLDNGLMCCSEHDIAAKCTPIRRFTVGGNADSDSLVVGWELEAGGSLDESHQLSIGLFDANGDIVLTLYSGSPSTSGDTVVDISGIADGQYYVAFSVSGEVNGITKIEKE
jgi:hypothetical protein